MTKALLYTKRYGLWIVIGLVTFLFLFLRFGGPRSTIGNPDLESDPIEPEEIESNDFLGALVKAKDENDEKIKHMSRSDLVDSINNDYE